MVVIENKYNIGDWVVLKTDIERRPRIVTSIKIMGVDGQIFYELACGSEASYHYDFEMEQAEVYREVGG